MFFNTRLEMSPAISEWWSAYELGLNGIVSYSSPLPPYFIYVVTDYYHTTVLGMGDISAYNPN